MKLKSQIAVCLTLVLALTLVPLTSRARYLNPNTGRFQTMDTYEGNSPDPLSLNKYVYARADTVNGVDPSGRFAVTMAALNMSASVALYAFSPGRTFESQWGDGRKLLGSMDFDAEDPSDLAQVHQSSLLLQLMDVKGEFRRGVAQVAEGNQASWDAWFAAYEMNEALVVDLLLGPLFVRACFAAETQVIVAIKQDGSHAAKAIADLREGDLVLARSQNDETGVVEVFPVVALHRKCSDHIRIVTFRAQNGERHIIRTTDEHPFWVKGLGWTRAADLCPEDRLSGPDNSDDAVVLNTRREGHAEGIDVYNLEIARAHTYFVGDDSCDTRAAVWVHNACNTPLGRGSTASRAAGTSLARNTRELMAIRQAMANPSVGARLPLVMTDSRWPASQGWIKMRQVIRTGGEPIDVHYVYNTITQEIDDFKIVLPGPR